MGWDIVAIGTNHKLPIDNPIKTAERISLLTNRPLSIGYYEDWKYSPSDHSITRGSYDWHEISRLNPNAKGKTILFSIENYSARKTYSQHFKSLRDIHFGNSDEREWFVECATGEPFAIYECDDDKPENFDLRVCKDIVEFTENFKGRWFQFVDALKDPESSPHKEHIQEFRNYIFQQMKACGCDVAYYFADQGSGEFLYDFINKPSKEWVEYLEKGDWAEDANPKIVEVRDLLNGSIVLSEEDWIDCFIDDFSDYKE